MWHCVISRGVIACQSARNCFKYYNLWYVVRFAWCYWEKISKFNFFHYLPASAVSVSDNFSSPHGDSRWGRGKWLEVTVPFNYIHVAANKLEYSCHRSMSLCNRFDFGTSKHPSMFYLSNHSTAKLTLNMQHNFRQPKHRRVRVPSPPSWIWIRDDKLTLVKSGCAKMFGELFFHVVVFNS